MSSEERNYQNGNNYQIKQQHLQREFGGEQQQQQQQQWFSPFMGPSNGGILQHVTGNNNYIESFTPILSPSSTPQVSLHQLSLTAAANSAFNNLSPLNSPALMPTLSYTDHQFHSLQQQDHNQDQNQLYDFNLPASSATFLPSTSTSSQSHGNSMQQKQPHSHPTPNSFQMSGHSNGDGSVTPLTLVPLTPSQLMQLSLNGMGMNLDSSSQQQHINTSSSSTSVSLYPSNSNIDNATDTAHNNLDSKKHTFSGKKRSSNENITSSVNLNAPYRSRQLSSQQQQQPVRKVSHKEAEQKRRDNLKNCFNIVKAVLLTSGERALSKVQILKQARAHILDLRHEKSQVEAERDSLVRHVDLLERLVSEMGMDVPERPVTAYEPRELGELDLISPNGEGYDQEE